MMEHPTDDMKPFVNDFKINLFEVAFLTEEQTRMFKSDFRIVADYFVQIRKTEPLLAKAGRFDLLLKQPEVVRALLYAFVL